MPASISELEARRDRLRAELGAVGDLRPGTAGRALSQVRQAELPLRARGRPGPRSGLDPSVAKNLYTG